MTTENTLQQLERTADDDSPLCDNSTINEELLHSDPNRSEIAAMEPYSRTPAKLREIDIAAGAPVSPLN